MSRENVEAFLSAAEALNTGDVDAALSVVGEDVVVVGLRSGVEGAYHGHAGVREFFRDNEHNFDVFRLDYTDVRDLGDRVLAIGTLHVRGRGGGVDADAPTAGGAGFCGGKKNRWGEFGD